MAKRTELSREKIVTKERNPSRRGTEIGINIHTLLFTVFSGNIQIFSFETTTVVNVCSSPPTVLNSVRSPDQATYNPMTTITYMCEFGYSHTSGDLTRVCQTDTSWSGNEPVCTSECKIYIYHIL